MKKFLTLLLAATLVACSNNPAPSTEPTMVSKACELEQNGMVLTLEAVAPSEDADVETVIITCEAPYEAMGITEDMLTDDMKDQLAELMESVMLSSIWQDDETAQYVEIQETTFNETGLYLSMEMDIKSMAEDQGVAEGQLSLDSYVESMSQSGFNCK